MAGLAEKQTVGFIGLGNMGSRMAARLLDAHYSLVVFNRNPERARSLAARGARVGSSPKDVAAACDVVITMVPDDTALDSIIFAPDGVLAGAGAGTTIIDMSSVSPHIARRVAQSAGKKNVQALDSPVSGSTPQAEQGTLTILVGGPKEVFDACKPLLEQMGKDVFHMGRSGMGATMKLVVNTLLGTQLQTLAEAIVLGVKAGLDKDTLLDVLGQTAHVSPGQKAKIENVRREDYPTQFPLALMFKDYGLISSLAAELAVPMPVTVAAQQICAVEKGRGRDEDVSAVLRLMEELAGTAPK